MKFKPLILAIIFIFIVSVIFFCYTRTHDNFENINNLSNDSLPLKSDNYTDTIPKLSDSVVVGKILPNHGFVNSLTEYNVSLKEALLLSNALRFEIDFRYLSAGEKFKIEYQEDNFIKKFTFHPNPITYHILHRDSAHQKFSYKEVVLPTQKRYRLISGEIETNLIDALLKENLSKGETQIVGGILECKVNFRYYARKGDNFNVLLEENYFKGEKINISRVLYASYSGIKVDTVKAYYYDDGDARSAYNGYYLSNGQALIPSSLRQPLEKIHVTSSFGYRIHPVTGKRAFHNGVDYRGRVGTLVYAVAKGKVVRTGYDSIAGKKVIIKHSDGTKTYYLHLNKILVSKGEYVKGHQVIGHVGETGRVTGPHLHFGIKEKTGKWLNPLLKKMIATPKLKDPRLSTFLNQIENIKKFHSSINFLNQCFLYYNPCLFY